jgi:hypothetical protein
LPVLSMLSCPLSGLFLIIVSSACLSLKIQQ